MSLYVNRNYAQESWHVRRYVLRIDGFASLNASHTGGQMLTKPLVFSGKALEINFATSAFGGIRIEIQDAQSNPIPGFTSDECPEIVGDRIEHVVFWNQGPDVSSFAGLTVRLRVELRDADIYSLRFRDSLLP
jgi:hypothetical protein